MYHTASDVIHRYVSCQRKKPFSGSIWHRFVDKNLNAQNYLQARPIEILWSILKNMVYDQGSETHNIDQLKQRVREKNVNEVE